MINQTILFLPQTDCSHAKIKPHARELGINVNWDPDLHLGVPLAKIFNRVIRFDVGESYCNDGVIQANKKITELVREHSPKYVIWPTMTYEIFEETFQEVRKMGAYVVLWFFDDETRFDDYSRWWIPYADYILTADNGSIVRYKKLVAKAYYMPVTCEPDDFNPSKTDTSYDVSFVGSKYVADRESMVNHFCEDGVSISTFGKGWENGFVSQDKMAQIFFNSKINICFTKAYTGERNQIKGKIFDITTCGGFLLCEYVDGIEDYFEIGKEIVCFDNYADALEKIHYYLANDEERERIAVAGKLRATSDLAQHNLLEKVFTVIESDIETNSERNIMPVLILQMSESIRMAHTQYHLRWATILKKIGFEKKYWQDERNLAHKYATFFTRMKFKCQYYIGIIVLLIRKVRTKIYFQKNKNDEELLLEKIKNYSLSNFSYDKLKTDTLNFVGSMKVGLSAFEYKYSPSCKLSNIYSSAYACMIFSMFVELDKLTIDEKNSWAQYFNSFQSEKDGLFYDESLKNEQYDDSDWWGARHLVLHMINVFIALGARPQYPFYFLEKYYDLDFLKTLLNEQNWLGKFTCENDIDNKLMNIVTALQYQRDFWQDEKAGKAVDFIQKYLFEKINPETGLWGYFDTSNKNELSRMIQFAYHLFPMYFYDNIEIGNKESIIDFVLKTQNIHGGFGVKLNSSACEDIDSIDILIRFSKQTAYKSKEIEISLKEAFSWVLSNQNADGGYVFRRNEPMFYGHKQMNSGKNESAMFPTWFRTLTIAYLANHSGKINFNIVKAPGY